MKFSYNWLRELAPNLTAEPGKLEQMITLKTAECEGVVASGEHFGQVIAVRILSVEALPKGKNRVVRIATGRGGVANVVCGAPNVRTGMLAVWVPPGTVLGGKTIARVVLDGVESEGMLASAAELGINRDHSGLLELEGIEPGERVRELDPDWIIEIDNKSLTHRPDLWGHYGMAREVAAITGSTLRDPVDVDLLPKGNGAIKVEIEDFALCPRYSALAFDNVQVGPSPLTLQARLESVDLNAINNLVDITNYVLAELPQPMHAFDRDKLAGDTIYVRRARGGEKLLALNCETYHLHETDLVIADASGPIALAGVIGGCDSAVSESTKRIVIESANFHPASVRLTSARHKLRTDASVRFEKSLDPENTLRGLARAAAMIREVCPEARADGGVTDRRGPVVHLQPIRLPVQFVAGKLGKPLEADQITGILRALGFGVDDAGAGALMVSVPSWRATKDISLKDDLVEEVGRMIGYGEIAPQAPLVASIVPPSNPMRLYQRQIRRQLVDQGFTEVYNYSFITAADAKRFQLNLDDHIGLRNPIASELTHLRRSLLPGLFANILKNLRHFKDFRLFEIGNELHPGENGGLPHEIPHLGAVIYSAHGGDQVFFELKRVAQCVLPAARLDSNKAAAVYAHPQRAALVSLEKTTVGHLFELHPSLLASEGVDGRVVVLDCNLQECLEQMQKRPFHYTPPRRYPTSGFDLSVVVPSRTAVGHVEDLLRDAAGENLSSIEFMRQYEGEPLAEGQKSVSYHLEIGALDHTMTTEEVSGIFGSIVSQIRIHGLEVRGVI